jgi:hypothetical protein
VVVIGTITTSLFEPIETTATTILFGNGTGKIVVGAGPDGEGLERSGVAPTLGCATIWFKPTLANERSCLVSSDSSTGKTGLRRVRREIDNIRLCKGRVAEGWLTWYLNVVGARTFRCENDGSTSLVQKACPAKEKKTGSSRSGNAECTDAVMVAATIAC